jgi:hypothetical protein
VYAIPSWPEKLDGNTFASTTGQSTIHIQGASAGDAHWNARGTATRYQLENHTTITAGDTLQIAPGVEVTTRDVSASGEYDPRLLIYGTVQATGIQVTGRTEFDVFDGGQLDLTDATVTGIAEDYIEYLAGSRGRIQTSTFAGLKL